MMTNQNFETPKKIFNFAQKYFNLKFDLDVCATKQNTLCKNYFTKKDNSLLKDWKIDHYYDSNKGKFEGIFLNPPYNQASKFIKKATEQNIKHDLNIVGLFNVITDTKVFHECFFYTNKDKKQIIKPNIEFYFIPKRITFNLNGIKSKYPNPKPSMLIFWKSTRIMTYNKKIHGILTEEIFLNLILAMNPQIIKLKQHIKNQ
jgi:phage N-6-adenine-methyltransferase